MDIPSAVVLPADGSSHAGRVKALDHLGEVTVLAHAVETFACIGIEDIIVVTGRRNSETAAAAEALGARLAWNARFAEGMHTSVQAGVAAVGEGRRFFLLPMTCPLARPETAGKLARAGTAIGAEIVLPVLDGVPGHPRLLAPTLREKILGDSAGGLRKLMTGQPRRPALRVTVDDPGVLLDIDTNGDLEQLRRLAATEDLPSQQRCLELLHEYGASEQLIRHSQAVADAALIIVAALNRRGQCICTSLVAAGALLHDISRSESRHEEAGAKLLTQLGYPRLAPVVRRHMHLLDDVSGPLNETKVVYLADKLVGEDRYIGLSARFRRRIEECAGDAPCHDAVLARYAEAGTVLEDVESVLGYALEKLLASP
jgi:molybdenum cofactor cytidylyltransferase